MPDNKSFFIIHGKIDAVFFKILKPVMDKVMSISGRSNFYWAKVCAVVGGLGMCASLAVSAFTSNTIFGSTFYSFLSLLWILFVMGNYSKAKRFEKAHEKMLKDGQLSMSDFSDLVKTTSHRALMFGMFIVFALITHTLYDLAFGIYSVSYYFMGYWKPPGKSLYARAKAKVKEFARKAVAAIPVPSLPKPVPAPVVSGA